MNPSIRIFLLCGALLLAQSTMATESAASIRDSIHPKVAEHPGPTHSAPGPIHPHAVERPDSTTTGSYSELLEVLLESGVINHTQWQRLAGHMSGSRSADLLGDDDDFGYTQAEMRTRRFRVRSEDGRDLFRLRGRLYLDGAMLGLEDPQNTVDDSREGRGNLGTYGTIIRNARIGAEGAMYEEFTWRLEVDFRDAEVRIRGAWLEYAGAGPVRVAVGNFKEPVGLEFVTPRGRTTFLERALSLDAFKPDWNMGLRVEQHGRRHHVSAVLMSGNGDNRDRQVTGGFAYGGRATVAPLMRGETWSHLGFGATYRVNAYTSRIDNNYNRQYLDVRKRTRLGTRAVDGRFIGADDLTDVYSYVTWSAEAALGSGPFSLQGELTGLQVNRDFLRDNLSLLGYYAQASWFLTGESRVYRPSRGNFGALYPVRAFRPGFGPGAVELAARFSRVDAIDHDYDGGQMDHFTAALNWYLNREMRVMFNYIWLDAERANGKRTRGSVYAMRVMFEF